MQNLHPWPNVRLYPYRDSIRRECFEVYVGPADDASKSGDIITSRHGGFWYKFAEHQFGKADTLQQAVNELLNGAIRTEAC